MDPRFANPAAWGDPGAADLINAVARGLRYTVDGHLGATYFVPAVFVPVLLVIHGVIVIEQVRVAREARLARALIVRG